MAGKKFQENVKDLSKVFRVYIERVRTHLIEAQEPHKVESHTMFSKGHRQSGNWQNRSLNPKYFQSTREYSTDYFHITVFV